MTRAEWEEVLAEQDRLEAATKRASCEEALRLLRETSPILRYGGSAGGGKTAQLEALRKQGPGCDLRPGGVNVPSFNGLLVGVDYADGPDSTAIWFVSWPRAPRPWWAELRDKACAALTAWREG